MSVENNRFDRKLMEPNHRAVSRSLPTRGICAYRGASSTHPENTCAACQEAVRLGAHMIEMDVCFSKDQHLVLMHDVSVDRTTNGSGAVGDFTLEEIKRLDAGRWKDRKFEGETVPTLAEVLQIMPVNIWLIAHLRGGEKIGKSAAQTVAGERRVHQTILSCGLEAATAALDADPRIAICMDKGFMNSGVRKMMAATEKFFLFRTKSDLAEETPALEAGSISIVYYDPGEILPADVPALFRAGVHFVISPRVRELVEAAKGQGILPLKPYYEAAGS